MEKIEQGLIDRRSGYGSGELKQCTVNELAEFLEELCDGGHIDAYLDSLNPAEYCEDCETVLRDDYCPTCRRSAHRTN